MFYISACIYLCCIFYFGYRTLMFYAHYDPNKRYSFINIYFPNFRLNKTVNIKDLSKLHFEDTSATHSVSSYNVGNSDYHKHKYQAWDAWQEYDLDPWDADIAKRVMRQKKGDPASLDYQKIKHVCDKQLQRIELGQKEFKPAGHEENAYDRFEDYHFDQWDAEILEIVLRHGAYYSLPPCYLRIQYLCDQQLQRIKLGLKK